MESMAEENRKVREEARTGTEGWCTMYTSILYVVFLSTNYYLSTVELS